MTNTTLRGVIRGRTIELDGDAGLPDGQSVTVLLQPVPEGDGDDATPEERFRRSCGAWADDAAGLDDYLRTMRNR
jgi:hypothetical protein